MLPISSLQGREGGFNLHRESRGNNYKLRTGKATVVQDCQESCVFSGPTLEEGLAPGRKGCQAAGSRKADNRWLPQPYSELVGLTSTWVYLKTSLTSLRMCT